jgi:hypothetical protein
MAKSFIVDESGQAISVTAPKIKAVHPFGSSVLVEMLKPDEVLNTKLYVGAKADSGSAPQGYVLELGPNLKSEEIGLRAGNRVILQGTFIPVINFDGNKRERGIVELHNIKAVIEESKD